MTAWHALASPENKIAEGAAPPFAMTLFIGGAQISLILTLLQLFATIDDHLADVTSMSNAYIFINGTETDPGVAARETFINDVRKLLVWTMAAKVYIVNFLRNNQEWARPANELKKSTVASTSAM